MELKDLDLKELVSLAKKAGACEEADEAEAFETMENLLAVCDEEIKAYWAYWYAAKIIKGRWPEAEPIILKDAEASYWYAVDVMNSVWPEAEDSIAKSYYKEAYENMFNVKIGTKP
jgi:hypothetical protein